MNLEVKFSIPPYVSLLARSVATLEGVALQGDKDYQIVAMAYPFVIRRLLTPRRIRVLYVYYIYHIIIYYMLFYILYII